MAAFFARRGRGGQACVPGKVYDVVVVGGGVMGVWATIQVRRRKKSACLLEQYEAAHTKGSSHGDGRIYRYAYEEMIYVDMMALALEDWQALQRAFPDVSVLAETGGVSLYGSPTGETSYDSHGSREHLSALYDRKGLDQGGNLG